MNRSKSQRLFKDEAFSNLPDFYENKDFFSDIQAEIRQSPRKVVVLDDDPTGTQTVHSIDVLTSWNAEDLVRAFKNDSKLFYILTNSRSMEVEQAISINEEIARNLCTVAKETGIDFDVISRSDSTLRGHYPDEMDVLEKIISEETEVKFDGQLIIPAFFEGGRFTMNDEHYVLEGDILVPACETEFSKDAVFGYKNSYLPDYIEEKTDGKYPAQSVVSISLKDLREGGSEKVTQILLNTKVNSRIIVNAVEYKDLEVFVLGLLQVEKLGKHYLVRSSASYVKIRGAVPPIPYLSKDEIAPESTNSIGGLVVVGSYVGKTSAQIDGAKKIDSLHVCEINVECLLNDQSRQEEISRVQETVEKAILEGIDVMIYTSRKLIKSDDKEENLKIGGMVSSALVAIVSSLKAQPRFLIAKGGITSSDLATEALKVKSARVIGQVAPGISVWKLKDETKFPGMSYVVFPGNVGTEETLAQVILLMSGKLNCLG
jgi:uncharacterized protein YgbK (DUF1537 family)